MHISVVSPVYKAPKILPELVARLENSLNEITDSFEVILVDDGCPWDSWGVIEELVNRFHFVKGIKLSRNFGQHYAIIAGLENAKGDWVIVMDCDLQDQPEEIIKLYKKAIEGEGFDAVLARRENRKDTFIKKTFSKIYSKIFNYLAGTKLTNEVGNFGLYSRKVIQSVLLINDYIKFFPLFVNFVGFKTTSISVDHSFRNSGKSSYDFCKLFNLAINSILSYSDKPLRISVIIGLTISIFTFTYGIVFLIRYLTGEVRVIGYTSIILSIWFLSGIIITIIGIVGIYLGKVFDQTKNRPVFIVDKII
jgi:dolichol-phosphate mannosyltransferase